MDVKQQKINPDLIKERRKCTFDTRELTYLIEGGKEKFQERKEREKLLLSIPGLKYDVPSEYLSHKEKYEQAIKRSCILFKTIRELQDEGKAGVDSYREVLGAHIGSAVLQDGNPLGLHYVMFIPTLMGQGNMEQQAEWIQRSWQLEIIGTYAQTELGHGTFIRGLETTATYDPTKEEFELNSPTLTSYKWWPGGLGHTANYAVVMAQLYTKGVCHGIHPFIVQLRDEDTHMPMPGIKIGEIGSKLGMNTTNNGYLGFEKVRIPRKNMLMRHNKILKDGTYIKAPSAKLTYGTMIFVRVVLVQDAASYLKKAVTIATRYSAVRHQSQIKEGDGEPQIIDFVTQQHKLFPNIATYFAFMFTSNWLWEMYNQYVGDLESGQLDGLPEVHALACCLKAVAAADCTNGVEICRLACGGHGYMTSSNLPTTYGLITPMCTYEGENTVLHLQTARYLIKEYQAVLEGKQMTPTLKYLETFRSATTKPFTRSIEWIISAMQKSAASKIRLAYNNIQARVRKGIEYEYAWNETSIELAAASEAHCRAVVIDIFYNKIMSIKSKVSEPLRKVLFDLLHLYAVHIALKVSGDLLRFTSISPSDIGELQSWLEELLAAIRPNAVGIVDSFEISDDVLCSTLGAYDGNVYERLFEEANKSPLNQEPVNESFHKYLKPFLKSKM